MYMLTTLNKNDLLLNTQHRIRKQNIEYITIVN